ncbi:MAG: ribosome-associated translation inhibitor RaiA [Ignavibacteria bacterium]|nr:ribosome-associated translation inhibitor RaiA [Ignavibacteria bacterium]MDH7528176.1 ribosome-associated translation inhibitor RaiA [Ignavibacteria bacterium]NPV10385.1 ribosome-associated translation inhibitor RaiA [Ignavibacteria bacterium]
MNVQVTARRFKAHESLKDYAIKEVKRLEKFNDNIHKADVILSYQRAHDSVKTAEVVLHLNGNSILAKESTDDFKKSIDLAVNKLERQLTKLKTKVIEKKRAVRSKK